MIVEGIKILASYWIHWLFIMTILFTLYLIVWRREIKRGNKGWLKRTINEIKQAHPNSVVKLLKDIQDFPTYLAISMAKIYRNQKEILYSIVINYFVITWIMGILSSYPSESKSYIFIAFALVIYIMMWVSWMLHHSFRIKLRDKNLFGIFSVYGWFILIILGTIFIQYNLSIVLGMALIIVVMISIVMETFDLFKGTSKSIISKVKGGKSNGQEQKR